MLCTWLRAEPCMTTAGRTARGGTGRTVTMVQSGRENLDNTQYTYRFNVRNVSKLWTYVHAHAQAQAQAQAHTHTHTMYTARTHTHTHTHTPGIHTQYTRVLVTNVFEYLQDSLGAQEYLLLLTVIVHFIPLCRQLQTALAILGLEPSAAARCLEHRQGNTITQFMYTMQYQCPSPKCAKVVYR